MSVKGERVLMLLQNAHYPEDERVLREATTLHEAGYAVTVICPRGNGQPRDETLDGIRVRRYRGLPVRGRSVPVVLEWFWALLAISLKSAECFTEGRFMVIHAHNPPDFLLLISAPYKLLGTQMVYDHHDLVPEMFDIRFGDRGSKARALLVLGERLSCRLADLVIEVNDSYREVDQERSGVLIERSVVIRNGPDHRMLSRPAMPPPRRSRLVVGYAGVIGHQDGVHVLVEAVDLLVRALGTDVFSCVIAGDGDARKAIERDVANRGLCGIVSFTGWLPYPRFIEAIEGFDIGVAPEPPNEYNRRSTLLKIMDYMALARPVVAFDLPEHRVTAGDAAVYAAGPTPAHLMSAIRELIENEDRRIEIGRCGRERAEQKLAWSVVSSSLLEAYARLS